MSYYHRITTIQTTGPNAIFPFLPLNRMKRKSRNGVFLLLLLCDLFLFVAVQLSCVSLFPVSFYSPSFNYAVEEVHKTRFVRREQSTVRPTLPIVQEKETPTPTTTQPSLSSFPNNDQWRDDRGSKDPAPTARDAHTYLLVLFTTEEVSLPSLLYV